MSNIITGDSSNRPEFIVNTEDAVIISDKPVEIQASIENHEVEQSINAEALVLDGDMAQMTFDDHHATIYVEMTGQGPRGERGLSAYELWLEQGNEGTIDDFLNSSLNYTHPAQHPAEMIVETDEKQFISFIEKSRISGYVHDQIAASRVWVINHTLDKYPAVAIVDTAGNLVGGDIEYVSKSRIIATFSAEFSGKAYLN